MANIGKRKHNLRTAKSRTNIILSQSGKDWQNVGQANWARSGIKFTLAFSGEYWHKKSDKMRVRKPYGKNWQNAAQANYGNEWYKL